MDTKGLLGISPKGWKTLLSWTLSGTAGCVVFSVIFNYFAFRDLDTVAVARALATATILPIMLAGPLFFYLTLKLRELARVNHQLNELATKDFGTGLLNRRALIMRVNDETAKMAFNPSISHLFLVVDADRFKAINDRFGHVQGDEALKLISAALGKSVRSYDIVGRIGGEEFAVFLPNVTTKDALYIADRLRRAVASALFCPNGKRYDLSVSIGGVIYQDAMAFTDLFKAADANLYAAKEQGRNCSVVTPLNEAYPPRDNNPNAANIAADANASAQRRHGLMDSPALA